MSLVEGAAHQVGAGPGPVPHHEEGGDDPEAAQLVQEGGGEVGVRPVVEGERHGVVGHREAPPGTHAPDRRP
jgi:hypothetical protein